MKNLTQESVLNLSLPVTFMLSRDIPMFFREDGLSCCGRGHVCCAFIQGNIGDQFTVDKFTGSMNSLEVTFKGQKICMTAYRVAWLVNDYCSPKNSKI